MPKQEATREEASETCDSHVRQMQELGNKTEVFAAFARHQGRAVR